MQDFNLTPFLLVKSKIKTIAEHKSKNNYLEEYYVRLAGEYSGRVKLRILEQLDRFKACNMENLVHEYSSVVNLVKSYHCKTKFCLNCKKIRQGKMIKKFLPELSKFDDELYMFTLTIPNVAGKDIKSTIDKLCKSYYKLHDIMSKLSSRNKKECKYCEKENYGNSFRRFEGYLGSVRSLEITINRSSRYKYHVHIHSAVALRDFKLSKRYIKNKFSEDHVGENADKYRLFTNEEVLLQKIWFLIYNDIDIDIDNLNYYKDINPFTNRVKTYKNDGYSCTIDKFRPYEYKEVFKYMVKDHVIDMDIKTKEVFKDKLLYNEFKELYFGTANVRSLQGYGCFFKIQDDAELFDDEDFDVAIEIFDKFIDYLNSSEKFKQHIWTIYDLLKTDKLVVTKNRIYNWLRELTLDELKSEKDVQVSALESKFIDREYIDELIWEFENHEEIEAKKEYEKFFKKVKKDVFLRALVSELIQLSNTPLQKIFNDSLK